MQNDCAQNTLDIRVAQAQKNICAKALKKHLCNLHDSLRSILPRWGRFLYPAFTPPQRKSVPPRKKTCIISKAKPRNQRRSSLQTQQANSLESSEIFNPWHPWLAWASATWFLWSDGRLEGKLQKKSPQFFFQKKTYFFSDMFLFVCEELLPRWYLFVWIYIMFIEIL